MNKLLIIGLLSWHIHANIALFRTVTMSSPMGSDDAASIVDGDVSTCAQTNTNANAFFEVYLGEGASVTTVTLEGTGATVGTFTVYMTVLGTDVECTLSSGTTYTCPFSASPSPYVKATGVGSLTLCELVVLGTLGTPHDPDPNSNSLYMSGVAPYGTVTFPSNGANEPSTVGDFSVQFFAKRSSTLANMMVVSQGVHECNSGDCCANGACFVIGWRANDQVVFNIWGSNLITCNEYPNLGWHRWTFTYDRVANIRKIYRDFTLQASDTADTRPTRLSSSGPIYVGQDVTYWQGSYGLYPFRGWLDNLRWFNRALQPEEIAATASFLLFPTQLMLDATFEDGTLSDSSGNGNNMASSGAGILVTNSTSPFNFTDGGPPVIENCSTDSSSSSGLSSGAIAGIVIGSVAGVCILGCICYYCCCDDSSARMQRKQARPIVTADGDTIVAVPLQPTQAGYYAGQPQQQQFVPQQQQQPVFAPQQQQPVYYPQQQQQPTYSTQPQYPGQQPAFYQPQPQPVYGAGAGYGGAPLAVGEQPPAYEGEGSQYGRQDTNNNISGFDANGYPIKPSAPPSP